jgi:DNA polymerase I-like protein with 3'-5' exonuclease and polymerase domains
MANAVEEFTDLGVLSVPDLIQAAKRRGIYVFDLETSGLNPRADRIEGIAFYIPEQETPDGVIPPTRAWYPFIDKTMIVSGATCGTCGRTTYTTEKMTECPSCHGAIVALAWESLRPDLDPEEVMEDLRELFEDETLTCVAQNIKFDASFMLLASGLEEGVTIKSKWADSMIALYVHDERLKRYGLKPNVKDIFGFEMQTYKETMKERGFAYEFGKPLGCYAMDDVEWTWKLYDWSLASIRKQDPDGRLEKVFWDIEMPLTQIIVEMQTTGVFIDYDWLGKVHEDLMFKKDDAYCDVMEEVHKRLDKVASPKAVVGDQFGLFGGSVGVPAVVRKGIRDWVGKPPNFNSPQDVSHLLYEPPCNSGIGLPTETLEETMQKKFEAKQLDYRKKKRAGKNPKVPVKAELQWPTDNTAISRFKQREPIIVTGILDWRSYDTVDSSFATKIMKLVEGEPDGRLYSQFIQTGTVIGRLSSKTPINLMNQPRGPNLIRKSFCSMLAEDMDGPIGMMQDRNGEYLPGHGPDMTVGCEDDIVLFGCDYDQIELKVAAHLSKDKAMLEVYRAAGVCQEGIYGCEFYQKKGRCRHCDLHQRSAEDIDVTRQLAKPFNFGLMYRMGPYTLCSNAGLYTRLGKPRTRYAKQLSKRWFKAYPGITRYHRRHETKLPGNSYKSFTLAGRVRRLRQDFRNNEFKAVTQSIQFSISGTAQDIMKTAMRRMHRAFKLKIENATSPRERHLWSLVKLILQIHDEIVGQCPRVLIPEVKEIVEWAMCGAASLDVPLTAACAFGQSWDFIH